MEGTKKQKYMKYHPLKESDHHDFQYPFHFGGDPKNNTISSPRSTQNKFFGQRRAPHNWIRNNSEKNG